MYVGIFFYYLKQIAYLKMWLPCHITGNKQLSFFVKVPAWLGIRNTPLLVFGLEPGHFWLALIYPSIKPDFHASFLNPDSARNPARSASNIAVNKASSILSSHCRWTMMARLVICRNHIVVGVCSGDRVNFQQASILMYGYSLVKISNWFGKLRYAEFSSFRKWQTCLEEFWYRTEP